MALRSIYARLWASKDLHNRQVRGLNLYVIHATPYLVVLERRIPEQILNATAHFETIAIGSLRQSYGLLLKRRVDDVLRLGVDANLDSGRMIGTALSGSEYLHIDPIARQQFGHQVLRQIAFLDVGGKRVLESFFPAFAAILHGLFAHLTNN